MKKEKDGNATDRTKIANVTDLVCWSQLPDLNANIMCLVS